MPRYSPLDLIEIWWWITGWAPWLTSRRWNANGKIVIIFRTRDRHYLILISVEASGGGSKL
jgi:hypothetical protein